MTFSGMRELNSGVLCFDKFLRKQWQCLKLFFPFKAYWVFASSRYDICEKRLGGCPRPVAVSSTMLCTAGHRSSNNQILKYCNMTFFFPEFPVCYLKGLHRPVKVGVFFPSQ